MFELMSLSWIHGKIVHACSYLGLNPWIHHVLEEMSPFGQALKVEFGLNPCMLHILHVHEKWVCKMVLFDSPLGLEFINWALKLVMQWI